jgi:RNA polymerase sigma-70 factor (ECF subfamily)
MDTFEQDLVAILPRLRTYAMVLTRDRARAEDLTQEAAVKILGARDKFVEGTNFKAWAYRILRNAFIDAARNSSRETRGDDYLFEQIESSDVSAEDTILLRQILNALESIPAEQKECLLLVYADGLQYDEVAGIQGCSLGTVKSRVFRAKQYLENIVGYDGPASTAPGWSSKNPRLPASTAPNVRKIDHAGP